jgi:cobalt-zinc-cadmium resistance protein CzcA
VLFGVAILNGLVLISGFNELKAEGNLSLKDLIIQGSKRRVRPILLTASTDILGFLPMAVSASAGAEVQRPLATVVIGGMLTSTLLTLVVLPVLYRYVESGKKSLKMPKPNVAVMIALIVGLGTLGSSKVSAQETPISLEQAIVLAMGKYPAIKAAQMEVEKQKALKPTAFDLGTTTFYTGKEEVASGMTGIHNQIGIEQTDIDLFSIPAKSKLIEAQQMMATRSLELTKSELVRNVSLAWFDAVYAKKQLILYRQLDTIYSGFEEAAELRYNTQQTSKIEFLSASAKYKELQLDIKQAASLHQAYLQVLNQYLLLSSAFDVEHDTSVTYGLLSQDSIDTSPLLEYHKSNIDVAMSRWKTERSGFLPKLGVSYVKQSVDGQNGFYGWEAGVSIPLLFFSQSGKTKASRIEYNIAEQEFAQKQLEIDASFNQLFSRYESLQGVLKYYIEEAIPLAEEQITASNLAYRLGNIDYIQFIQNIETAINAKREYIIQQSEFSEIETELQYIIGK